VDWVGQSQGGNGERSDMRPEHVISAVMGAEKCRRADLFIEARKGKKERKGVVEGKDRR